MTILLNFCHSRTMAQPSLNFVAVALLAELHGRCGHFPAHWRMRLVASSTPPQYEAAEIINLQAGEMARKQR